MTSRKPGKVAGPLCPECESAATRVRSTGYGHDDERIRARRCDDCRHRFLTIEVPITGVTWGELVPVAREGNRQRHYRELGYQPAPQRRHPIASLDVKVTVRRYSPRVAA